MKKYQNRIAISLATILLVILIFNTRTFIKKESKKNYLINRDKLSKIKIDLSDYQIVNKIGDKNYNINKFIYAYDMSSCPGCIALMYESLDKIISIEESEIDIIIMYSNFNKGKNNSFKFKMIKKYCDSFYNQYYKKVNFYFSTRKQYKNVNIRPIPLLLAYKHNELKFGFRFRDKMKPLLKMLEQYY